MLRSSLLLVAAGLFADLAVPQIAPAAMWTVEADCKKGKWTVEVELVGFGTVDASCANGTENRLAVDVGDVAVTGGSIAAISDVGTACDLPTGSDSRFALECAGRSEASSGFDLEESVEIEVELEETDGGEGETSPE